MTANAAPTILQVIPQLDTGGAELSTIEIAEAVTRAGGRALVASEGGRWEDALREAGGELFRLPLSTKNPLRILKNATALAELVRAENASLIHARSRAPAWSALLAARRTGIPFVTTYHGAYNQRSRLKGWYNSVMARGDAVIANSRYTAELLIARHGTPRDRVHVVHRGVDMERFAPERVPPEQVERLREAWGVKPGQRVVLQIARLTRWKGQEVVIRAATALLARPDATDVVFILAGDAQGRTEYESELRKLIKKGNATDRIRLVGHCDDVPAACLAADLIVVASQEPEAFGRASAEAQAMGRPVIVTDLGALPETLLAVGSVDFERATGWLVAPGNSRDMEKCIHEALKISVSDLRDMGERAKLHCAANFTKYGMQLRTLQVYDSLLGVQFARKFEANSPAASRSAPDSPARDR